MIVIIFILGIASALGLIGTIQFYINKTEEAKCIFFMSMALSNLAIAFILIEKL